MRHREGQAFRSRGLDQRQPSHARLDGRDLLRLVDLDLVHGGEVDQQTAIAERRAVCVVAAGAHGDLQLVLASVSDGGDNVLGRLRLDDHVRGALWLRHVPDHGLAPQLIVGILAADHLAADARDRQSRGLACACGFWRAQRHERADGG